MRLAMQAAVQPYVDNSISKTINVPEDFNFDRFKTLCQTAYDKGLKGCTTFRSNPVTGEVLSSVEDATLCCSIEREADRRLASPAAPSPPNEQPWTSRSTGTAGDNARKPSHAFHPPYNNAILFARTPR